jgi:predicted RNase H-like nuclease (RuvC/YqgF family)
MNNDDLLAARINTLKEVQSARKEDAAERVYKAIERLQKIDAKVNFTTVAKEANVSVSYLYKYPEIKQHIAEARNKQRSFPITPVAQPNSSSSGKVITRLKDKIQQLERENQELKRKNEALAGQVYRVHYLQEQVERQQQVIEDLNSKLKDQQLASKVTPISVKQKAIISERVQAELENLGVELNPTLTKTIKSATESTVWDAIKAMKEQLIKKDIPNPGSWLNQAINEGWTKQEPVLQSSSPKPAHQVFTAHQQPAKELLSLDKLQQLSSIFKQKDE